MGYGKGYLASFKGQKVVFKVVNSFPDLKVQFVDSFGDYKVKISDSRSFAKNYWNSSSNFFPWCKVTKS